MLNHVKPFISPSAISVVLIANTSQVRAATMLLLFVGLTRMQKVYFHCTVYRLYQGVLYLRNVIRFHCAQITVISITAKKSAAFPQPIFMKLANSQQRTMQIPYIEFHQNRLRNAESTDKISFTPRSTVFSMPIFTRFAICQQMFTDISGTKLFLI
jgi:hypothetical protein